MEGDYWYFIGLAFILYGIWSLVDVIRKPQETEGANYSHDFSVKLGSLFSIVLGGFILLSKLL